MIVLAAAFLAPGKIALLYIIYGLSLLLVAGVYAAIWRVGTLMDDRRRFLTLLMALVWSVILIDRRHLLLVGMESTVHMAVLWGSLIAGLTTLKKDVDKSGSSGNWYLLFTAATVLVTWARLDAALFSFALYAFITYNIAKNGNIGTVITRRYIAYSLVIAITGAVLQIGFFYSAGGTVIPISALVKQTGIGPEIAVGAWGRLMSVIFPFSTFVDENSPWFWLVEAVFFAALLFYVVMRACRSEPPIGYLHGVAASLGATIIVYAGIVGGGHDPFWRWYLAPVFLFYMLGIACAFHEAFGRLNGRLLGSKSAAGIACAIAVPLFLVVMAATHRPIPLYLTRAQVGLFLKDTAGKGDVFASFNSGQVGFLSEHPMINLDGLVNSRDYLNNVFNKPDRIIAYLNKYNVRYIIDYNFYWASEEILKNTTLKYTFEIPGDYKQRSLYVREMNAR